MKGSLPHGVVLGMSPTGLYVLRELGGFGVDVIGVDKEFACASWSRFIRAAGKCWIESSRDRLVSKLIDFAKSVEEKPVLIPTSDYYIEFLIENFELLSEEFLVSTGYKRAALALLDKTLFSELCVGANIEAPRIWRLSKDSDVSAFESEIKYPCILKPVFIHLAKPFLRGEKLLVVNSITETRELMSKFPSESGDWFLQELVPGEESRITLLAGIATDDGDLSEYFTARKLRQYPPGFGSASLVESEECEETARLSKRLVRAAGYSGIFGAEFKRDPRDGRLKAIEINPRPTLWFQISHDAGKRIVQKLVEELVGVDSNAGEVQRNGVVWRYLLKDMYSKIFYMLVPRRFALPPPDVSSTRRVAGRSWPVFSLDDPLPVFAEFLVSIRKFVGRIV
ncbi:hypothetical protein BST95_00395 [Halioglobus japonicus]|nr:hypothetical protein [Halioglobus japonicus]AQA16907.1 hypothetical protein BST95_00395 [Halioglobus japonicus]GHD21446.1 hypothetical protein GCM10007052_32220 [Halioglobus japonicus]